MSLERKKCFKWRSFPFSDAEIFSPVSRSRQNPYANPRITMVKALNDTVSTLLDSSLATSTRHMYKRIWQDFDKFCCVYLTPFEAEVPVSITTLSLYLAFIHQKGYAPATLFSYNSAIGYVHKIRNQADPSTSFLISKLLQGAKKSNSKVNGRLPITMSILKKWILAL